MLLLLTVGLLLIGLVTLVIGFLNSSLALDYISIAASALSFTLVLLFTRLGRARSARTAAARGRQAPAPLAQNATSVIDLDSDDYLGPEPETSPRTQRTARTASASVEPTAYDFDEPPLDEEDELPLEELNEADEPLWEPEPPAPTTTRPAASRSPYERPSSPRADAAPPPPPAAPPPAHVAPERPPVATGDHGDDPYGSDRDAEGGYEAEGDGLVEEEGYDDLEFPIADYDELRVGEVLPLLEELEPDEIDVVREREVSGRHRAVILHKLDDLAGGPGFPGPEGPVTAGTPTVRPSVAPPPAARPPAATPPAARPPAARPPVARPPAASDVNGARRPAVVEPPVEVGYDDEAAHYDQDYDVAEEGYDEEASAGKGDAFPIADYDDLRLTEVLPLLPKLEPAELEMVRQRELQGERRATLLNRIDALIGTRSPRSPARQGR